MRKKLHEIMGVPSEDKAVETPEYPALPDEFNRFAPTEEPTEEEKPSLVRKVMLLLAAAGLATLGIFWGRDLEASASAPVEAEATVAPIVTQQPDVTPLITAQPTPQPTATPSPTPVVLTGTIHIVVYTDVFSMDALSEDAIYPCEILADETFDAETFTSYTLPPLPTAEGFTAKGYVLLAYPGMAYFQSLYFDGEQPRAIGTVALGDTVTLNDLAIVPANIDGVHEAEIHTVWVQHGGDFLVEFYDGDLLGRYPVGFPMYSEGLVYLAAFPKPSREGYTFVGWRDKDGNLIDALTYFDFYEPLPDAQSMEDRDWQNKIPCRLYATWADDAGRQKLFEVSPDAQVIYYRTHSVTNAIVTLTDPQHITGVHVRIYDEVSQDSAFDYDFTRDELQKGVWEQSFDLNDFYWKHMDLFETMGVFPDPPLEVTVTYRLDDGTTGSVTRVAQPQPEEYAFVDYDDESEEATAYTFPGCFVASVNSTENPENMLFADVGQALEPGEICVSVMCNGEPIPPEYFRLAVVPDIFEYDGVTYTYYSYYLVIQRPASFPTHGLATVTVRQKFLHYDYEKIYTVEQDY